MRKKILNILKFLKDVERLKSTMRHSWLSSGRRESVAEHSWRMAVLALILEKEFPEIDISKVIRMVIVHDFGEVYEGDIPKFKKQPPNKVGKEEKAVRKLVRPLPSDIQKEIISLWLEFHKNKTPEAKLAKILDGLEVLIQHNEANLSTWDPVEYDFNLVMSKKYTDFHDFIKEFRNIIHEQTKEKISKG